MTDYKVFLTFDNGEKKVFNVTPYIHGDWFGMLKDLHFFRTVHVSGRTIEWADGQDIAPHELYDDSVICMN
jgi:hypothetical protein